MSIQNYVKDLEFEAFILSECDEVFSCGIHHLAHGLVTVPTMLHCHIILAPFGVYLSLINFTYFTTSFQNFYFESCCVFTIFTLKNSKLFHK